MSQYQFQAPPLSKLNKIILITTVSCFLISSILNAIGAYSLVNFLGLSASGLFHGLIYQLVTYPFLETQLMGVLFNSLVVWFIGSEFEMKWGMKIYFRFLLLIVVGVGLIYSLVNLIFFFGTPAYFAALHGLGGVNFALLIAYSILYPDRQMLLIVFPVRARTFCWILVGIEAYMALLGNFRTSWAHLLAMGLSFLIIHFQNNPLIKKALNTTWKPRPSDKKHLYVVKDEEQKPPKYWQ
jgi:membrane associated rhomboid family serine protease